MERYEVFYRDTLIGILTVDSTTGMHSYEPNEDGVSAVKQTVPLTHEMLDGTLGFVEPIPFFQNRLKYMKRYGLSEINYQTDYFTIRQCK